MSHTGVGGAVVRSSGPDGARRAGLAGLQSCGSVWACPVCARRISAQRSADVRQVLVAAGRTGGSAALVTLTMRHRAGMALALLFTVLTKAWSSVTSGRGWVADQETFGVRGWLRTVEATHGEHGWHLRVHCAVIFDDRLSDEMMSEFGHRMFDRWQRRLVKLGFSAVAERGGLDVRQIGLADAGSVDAMADYLSKITHEMTSPSTKDGRYGNRSPFAILRDALGTGLAEDCELWIEWEQASHGRKQLPWSHDIRAWAGLHREQSDQEIVEDDMGGEDVLVIPPVSWPLVRPPVASLLDAVERDGTAGGIAWMAARGLAWSLPTGSGRGDHGPSG